MLKKLKALPLLNKILIVAGLSTLLLFAGYIIFTKKPGMRYYIPKNYEGWVTIRFEKPGTPPLELVDGLYHVYIPDSGILETSTRLEFGWGKQEYYRWDGQNRNSAEKVEKWTKEGEQTEIHGFVHDLHNQEMDTMDVVQVIQSNPDLEDTTLWDGTTISIKGDQADVHTGREILQHFYLTKNREPYSFIHPEVPEKRKRW